MLLEFEKFCAKLQKSFNEIGIPETLERYFHYPTRYDILFVVCVRLNAAMLHENLNVSTEMSSVYDTLQYYLENPDAVKNHVTSKDSLIQLLTTQQLEGYPTPSVKYVDGVLRYNVGTSIEDYIFKDTFAIDKHTTCTEPINIIKQLIKVQTKPEVVELLNTRLKVLKKIATISLKLETPIGVVKIDVQGAKLKTAVHVMSGTTQIIIN